MKRILDDNLIKHLYCDEGLSISEVRQKLSCANRSLTSVLHRLGCVRTLSEAQKLARQKGKIRMPRTGKTIMDDGIVQKLYCDDKLNGYEIARQLDCHPQTVYSSLRRSGCLRSHSEAHMLARVRGANLGGQPKGSGNHNWKGGKRTHGGYFVVRRPEHPRASCGYVREHILVWEEAHGRPLPNGWVVHHLNGVKTDNRPSNLAAMSRNKHANVIPTLKQKIRELEIEVRQLRKLLEDGQMAFPISEN